MRRAALLFCACAFLLTTGCASIVSSKHYSVSINSDPQGAEVVVTDKGGREVFRGETPAVARLAAGEAYFSSARYRFEFEKPGYGSATAMLSANLDGWYVGNILFGGIIGFFIVDPLTGNMWKLNEYVYATLPDGSAEAATDTPAPAPPAPTAAEEDEPDDGATDELSEDLRLLRRLHSEGVITDEEYARKRQEIIDRWEP